MGYVKGGFLVRLTVVFLALTLVSGCGTVWAWGSNYYRHLGVGTWEAYIYTPRQVVAPE